MPRRTTAALRAAAADALGVEIIAYGRSSAYYDDDAYAWYALTRADLAYALECRATYGAAAYSHWCAGSGRLLSPRSARRITG